MVQPLQKIVWQFFKKLNRITIWFSNPTLVYISKITENRDLNRSLYIHAHSSTFHNSQKAEATQVFMTWIDKQNVVYKYNGILLSLKRNEILKHATTCMNFDDITLTEINQSEKDLSRVCVCVCPRARPGAQSHPTLRPYGLQPTRLLCPWDFSGKNTEVGCHFLLQGIFPT